MFRSSAVVVLAFCPGLVVADDGVPAVVFPRTNGIPVRDKAGEKIGQWANGEATVRKTGDADWIEVRHRNGSPPVGWVKRGEVVSLADAPAYYTRKLRDDPADVWAWTQRGWAWSKKGEHDNAIKDFTEAIRLDPSATNYLHRGLALNQRGDHEKAAADFTESIRLDPTMSQAFESRGLARMKLKQLDEAIGDLNEAVRLAPGDADVHNNRGVAWSKKGDTDRAIADYTTAIRLDPTLAVAYANRGRQWEKKPEFGRAAADYAKAAETDPRYARAYNVHAWLLASCSDAKWRDGAKAVTLATRACELTGRKDANYLDTLAAAHAEAGDFDRAVETAKAALALPGTSPAVTAEIREHMALFEARRPYHQPPPAKKD